MQAERTSSAQGILDMFVGAGIGDAIKARTRDAVGTSVGEVVEARVRNIVGDGVGDVVGAYETM